jgi:hypothetical protein
MPRNVYTHPFVIEPPDDFVGKHPELRRLSQALRHKYADRIVVAEQDLQVMGQALWQALGVQADFETAHNGAGMAILPLVFQSGAAEVHALPWETLYHPTHGFLGKHPGFTLTRRMGSPKPSTIPLSKGPLRVLLFTSLPEDVHPETGRLNVEEEQIQVQEALLPWIAKGLVQLEMPDDGRFSTLEELLKSFEPQVLYLSGHGRFHHEPHTGEAPYGEFLFESEAGDGEAVREEAIGRALVGTSVQLIVLSACESGKAASEALTNGLAQRLSAQGVAHVIGMRETVLDSAGIQFAHALCDALAQRERVDTAMQAGRIAIEKPLKGIMRRDTGAGALDELSLGQWCLPTLLSPNPAQPLIDWDFKPEARGGHYCEPEPERH